MKLGKVKIELEYVVDLDNEEMVNDAKTYMYEDIMNIVKYEEFFDIIEVTDEDKTLKEEDIPDLFFNSKNTKHQK